MSALLLTRLIYQPIQEKRHKWMTCITESSSEITHNVAHFHKTGLRTCLDRVFLTLVYFFPNNNLVSTPQPGCHCVFQVPLAVANIKKLASSESASVPPWDLPKQVPGPCQPVYLVTWSSLRHCLILTCWPECITSISIVMEPPRRGEW